MHLWQMHGGGLHLRPDKITQFQPEQLRQLIMMAASSQGPTQPPPAKSVDVATLGMGHQGLTNGAQSSHVATSQASSFFGQEYQSPLQKSYDGVRDHPYRPSPRYGDSLAQSPRDERVQNNNDMGRSVDEAEAVCNLCERKCRGHENLLRHKREMHPTNRCLVYMCRKCRCEFVIKRTARLHMKEHGIYGGYDAFSTVRNARAPELPLLHCKSAGCPFRTSDPSLVPHDQHRVQMFEKISDQEYQEIRNKGRRDSSISSNMGSRRPHSIRSPDRPHSNRSPDKEKLRKVECDVVDGYIRIPAEGMHGRYILVAADPGNEADDLIINVRQPAQNHSSPSSAASSLGSLFAGLNESGLKQLEMLFKQGQTHNRQPNF